MKTAEIKDLTVEELENKLIELKESYFNLRFQHGVGQLENTSLLKKIRKDIAKAKTFISQKS